MDGLSFSWPPVGDGQDSWRLIDGNAAYRRDYDASGRYRVGDAVKSSLDAPDESIPALSKW